MKMISGWLQGIVVVAFLGGIMVFGGGIGVLLDAAFMQRDGWRAEVFASSEGEEVQESLSSAAQKDQAASVRLRRRHALKSCKQYEGKLLGYYSEVFEVVNCERVPVSHRQLTEFLKQGRSVIKIGAEVVYALPLWKPKKSVSSSTLRWNCQELTGTYITDDHETVYFVEGCKRRQFADWLSYNEHRFRRGVHQSRFKFLDTELLQRIPLGKPFPAIQQLQSLPDASAEVAMSRREACRGMEGKIVSYFSKLYKIQNCYKRPLNTVEFSLLLNILSEQQKEARKTEMAAQGRRLAYEAISANSATAQESDQDKRFLKVSSSSAKEDTQKTAAEAEREIEKVDKEKKEEKEAEVQYDITIPQVHRIDSRRWLALPLGKPLVLDPDHYRQVRVSSDVSDDDLQQVDDQETASEVEKKDDGQGTDPS